MNDTQHSGAPEPVKAARRHRVWGPVQFSQELGLSLGAFDRALRDGEIPAADAGTPARPGRWSADTVAAVLARGEQIRAKVGTFPDVGAWKAAEILSARLGREVAPETVEQLARVGAIPQVGEYKGFPLYCGRAVERFTDADALTRAESDGRLFTLTEAAAQLRVRASDLRHLVAAHWLEPVKHVHSGWQRRRENPKVALFRAADLDVIAAHPAIDWDAVRATAAGRPSPLARLTAGGRARVERGR
ncbi:hypothetical protein IU500_34445 [Nocardia terpenica]|uniref:hypothetical protein n=1 Tax=Nocardia terpenica TaxID=455432 RepID=UPI0018952671|nr:hypothetical protein [Nocardia terpenica]MBF6065435.1 hypothetical protein [Nocardia terpenica]MBF6109117.1 hypothetical protein [Nocardia terpenica]MBF6114681.1 hypothetical protein [Nocardia terpenica]MBF6123366.1 hypothetical protein [Nocardia terpenica]MBF6156616.1 hypothetical protein [Nocardia terpenica]